MMKPDIPYVESGNERQVLDIYGPDDGSQALLPVMFWIHGGGWVTGDKSEVALKPQVLQDRGFLFVSINYRLLPEIGMDELIRDVARALGWVHRNIAGHGGDPTRIIVGGHSSGAQLAALISTCHRYLEEEAIPPEVIRGCLSVDGDTYDIPKIIQIAELRQDIYGESPITFGHRQKFGNDPDLHIDYSTVTHVAKGKSIPSFLIVYFSGNPDTTAQAHRLEDVLKEAGIPVIVFGKEDTNHERLNDDLGRADDPATHELYRFLDGQLARK